MVNKNNLPRISLSLLSVIAVIVSFGFLWYMLRNSDGTFVQRVMTVIILAAISSIVLIVLIWIGAKVDKSLAGISQKNKRVVLTLLAYIFIPAICAAGVGILSLLFATGFGDTWGKDASFGIFFLGMFVAIPFAFGTVFIYLGAIVSALSRWVTSLIWRETESA
jgi:hypothetical protein